MSERYPEFRFALPATEPRGVRPEVWVRGLLGVILLFTAACQPNTTTVQSTNIQSSHGCAGSQTVIAHNGDNLTILVRNHVSGSYATEQVVDIVVEMNGIANRNVIHANQQYRLPATCRGP